jgi:hypothetical protein
MQIDGWHCRKCTIYICRDHILYTLVTDILSDIWLSSWYVFMTKSSYLVTPWNSVLLENLTVCKQIKRSPACCRTQNIITRLWTLSWVDWICPYRNALFHKVPHLCLGLVSSVFLSDSLMLRSGFWWVYVGLLTRNSLSSLNLFYVCPVQFFS